jgi:putative tricarboxylic transport membrane protein
MAEPHGGRADRGGVAIAVGVLALAAIILWDQAGLQLTSVYGVGPKAMPIVVAGGLAVLGIANLITAMRGQLPARESVDGKAILFILGGLAALIALIGLGGGFIVATAVLFAATSAAFGRRAVFTDLAIGIVIGAVVYLMFDKVLTLSLPAGPLERLL